MPGANFDELNKCCFTNYHEMQTLTFYTSVDLLFDVFLCVLNKLMYCFLITFSSVPDVTVSSLATDWFYLLRHII